MPSAADRLSGGPALVRGLDGFALGEHDAVYLEPLGLTTGLAAEAAATAGRALTLAGGPAVFTHARLWRRGNGEVAGALATADELMAWSAAQAQAGDNRVAELLGNATRPRPAFAGLPLAGPGWQPHLMGIVNVTPDSFSDGGEFDTPEAAIAHGRMLIADGAEIVDVGGESTRPGAEPVPVAEELARVVPVVAALAAEGALVSVDTRRADVMRQALAAGARIVNDVTALAGDPDSLAVVAEAKVPVVLMHMMGEPRTMQEAPAYDDVVFDVYDALAERLRVCQAAGIERDAIAIDPGIGFGKTVEHNLSLIARMAVFHGLGCALLLGVSRKSFIGWLSRDEPPKGRLPGSLVAGLGGLSGGAQLLRVHDVAETAQALSLWHGLRSAS